MGVHICFRVGTPIEPCSPCLGKRCLLPARVAPWGLCKADVLTALFKMASQYGGLHLQLKHGAPDGALDQVLDLGLNRADTMSNTNSFDELGFARTGTTHPLGTFDAQLERINMHESTIDQLRAQASAKGLTLSEYVRTILEVQAWGLAHVQRMHAERLARIVNNAGV